MRFILKDCVYLKMKHCPGQPARENTEKLRKVIEAH